MPLRPAGGPKVRAAEHGMPHPRAETGSDSWPPLRFPPQLSGETAEKEEVLKLWGLKQTLAAEAPEQGQGVGLTIPNTRVSENTDLSNLAEIEL